VKFAIGRFAKEFYDDIRLSVEDLPVPSVGRRTSFFQLSKKRNKGIHRSYRIVRFIYINIVMFLFKFKCVLVATSVSHYYHYYMTIFIFIYFCSRWTE